MEEPTFTAIDYNSLENKVIEGLVRDNYSKKEYFLQGIQRMIISRPGFRMNQEMFRQYGKG